MKKERLNIAHGQVLIERRNSVNVVLGDKLVN